LWNYKEKFDEFCVLNGDVYGFIEEILMLIYSSLFTLVASSKTDRKEIGDGAT
jgi:hypothetical protein